MQGMSKQTIGQKPMLIIAFELKSDEFCRENGVCGDDAEVQRREEELLRVYFQIPNLVKPRKNVTIHCPHAHNDFSVCAMKSRQ